MSDQIKFSEEESNKSFLNVVRLKKIRTVYGLNSITEHFAKELKDLALEELLQVDSSISTLMNKIKSMRPNMIVIQKESMFVCIDTEVQLGEFMALRHKKLIGSGTYEQMQEAVWLKLQKEWDGRLDTLKQEEIDDEWLKNFCQVHYKNTNVFKIIKL